MAETRHWIKTLVVTGLLGFPLQGYADVGGEGPAVPPQDGSISKTILHVGQEVENLLKPTAWQAIEEGYRREVSVFSCDNGGDARGRRGVLQRVVLNQQTAQPIVASAWSKAEGVTGTIDSDYALYLDLAFYDGTELWGQVAGFRTGTHGWQREKVVLFPEKSIKAVDSISALPSPCWQFCPDHLDQPLLDLIGQPAPDFHDQGKVWVFWGKGVGRSILMCRFPVAGMRVMAIGDRWVELVIPDDLASALRANSAAAAIFEKFSSSHRREYVDWINEAKTQATHTRRLEQAVSSGWPRTSQGTGSITPARKFRILAHTNPTRQRGL